MKPPKGAAFTLSVFVASAVVLFGVVVTGYLVSRFNDPEAYTWAPRLLDRRLAVAGGSALLLACIAAAAAVRLTRRERPGPASVLLVLALAAGCVAAGARALECPPAAKLAGVARARPEAAAKPAPKPKGSVPALSPASATRGKPVYMKTCAACHAPDGAGIKSQGASLKDSAFVKGKSDDQLLAFVKVGRQPFDPETRMHLSMPARGGNPSLSDQDLFDAVAVLRELQVAADAIVSKPTDGTLAALAAPPKPPSDQPQMIDGTLWYPHSILAAASVGPRGTARTIVRLQKPGAVGRAPENVRRFFSFALLVSGLHGIYLAIGVLMGVAVIAHAPSRRSPAALRLVAFYWVVIAGMGLLLVPVTYF